MQNNQIIIYKTENGETVIDVLNVLQIILLLH